MQNKLHFNNFREFCDFYKDRWVMPQEFKGLLAKRNLHNILIILHLAMLYGGMGLLAFFVFHHSELQDITIKYRCLYYVGYIAFSIADLLLAVLIRTFVKNKYFFKNIPLYLAIIFYISFDIILFGYFEQPFQGTILYACIGVVVVMFFNVSPILYLVMSVYIIGHAWPIIQDSFGHLGVIDFAVLTMLIMFLAMFKWRITKKDLIKSELLDTHRQALKEEVDFQNTELQKQHEKIIEIQNNTIISHSNLVEN